MAAIFRRAISVFRHNPPGKHKGLSPTLCRGASLSISRTVCLPAQEHVLSTEQTLVACVSKKEDTQAWSPIFGGLALATAAAFGHPTLMSVYKPSTLVSTSSHIDTHGRITHPHRMHILRIYGEITNCHIPQSFWRRIAAHAHCTPKS